MAGNRAIRPGHIIAQCLIAANGNFVSFVDIRDFMIEKGYETAAKMIPAYIGDIKKYDYGDIEKRGDSVRLKNYESFNTNGQNRRAPSSIIVKDRDRGGIYQLTNNKNGFKYIGQAMNFGRRWANHRRLLRTGTDHHSPFLQKDWNEFGKDSFSFGIVVVCELCQLNYYESVVIRAFQPEYNIRNF